MRVSCFTFSLAECSLLIFFGFLLAPFSWFRSLWVCVCGLRKLRRVQPPSYSCFMLNAYAQIEIMKHCNCCFAENKIETYLRLPTLSLASLQKAICAAVKRRQWVRIHKIYGRMLMFFSTFYLFAIQFSKRIQRTWIFGASFCVCKCVPFTSLRIFSMSRRLLFIFFSLFLFFFFWAQLLSSFWTKYVEFHFRFFLPLFVIWRFGADTHSCLCSFQLAILSFHNGPSFSRVFFFLFSLRCCLLWTRFRFCFRRTLA